MDKKPSEYIEDFLKFLRDAQTECNIALQKESDAEKETQDILHWLEFNVGLNPSTASTIVWFKVIVELSEVRQRRREAKDTKAVMKPVVDWIIENESVRKGLERLLGDVRKAEKKIDNRYYTDRTNIMTEILGLPKENAADRAEE